MPEKLATVTRLRNRKERRASVVHRFLPLFRSQDRKALQEGSENFIEGELGDYLVISVPESTSVETAKAIKAAAQEKLQKPCLVITHNLTFMRTERLSASEAAKVLAQIENPQPEPAAEPTE